VEGPIRATTPAGSQVDLEDEWAACDACAELIEAADYAGLIERTLDADPVPRGMEGDPRIRELLRPMKAELYSAFAIRRGKRRPIT
jgi:hypothetical protein